MKTFLARLRRTSRGFTLLEALIAVTILVLAVSGPFYAATIVLNNVLLANDKTMASYLAQEGTEYVRMMRDNIFLADVAAKNPNASTQLYFYDDFMAGGSVDAITTCLGPGDGTKSCALDPTSARGTGSGLALRVCAQANCSDMPLYLGASGYTLTAGANATTPFARSIQLYTYSDSVEAVVTVSWSEHGIPYKVVSTAYLFPWQ